ncbi:MAG: hypothetical protein R6U25_05140, partial [Alkalispirochaeta sp.]
PEDKHQDLDFIMSLIDWDLNVDPDLYRNRFSPPKPVNDVNEMREHGYEEMWVTYKSEYFSAKELTVLPGRTVEISDNGAYGAIVVQGRGTMGPLSISSPSMIRFGEMTEDEVFVAADAARSGVQITNTSDYENLVMLKHFGPAV